VPVDFHGKLSFTPNEETVDEINSDIKDAIEEAVESEIDGDLDVEILTAEQIALLPADCRSGVVRSFLDSYSTRKSGSQFIGKAKTAFYFYSTPRSEKPVFAITIEEEGARHWGDQVPLENAFDELADGLEDELEDHDQIKILDPNKK
jgi:hypothetical protein